MIFGIEGLPGAGKTTVIEQLPYPHVPEMLVSADEEAAFSERDYIEHDERKVSLAYSLGNRGICLMDRTSLSFHAYSYALGDITDEALPIPQPESVHFIYLDIPVELSAERRIERQWIPAAEFTERVALFYERQFSEMNGRVSRIDATQPLDAVVADVEATIAKYTRA